MLILQCPRYFLGILSSYTPILQSDSCKSSKAKKCEVVSLQSFLFGELYVQYRTFENSCPSRYKGTFILFFFQHRVIDLAHYWLVTHECAALNTPRLFPSKMVASELTRKMCSEQGEAAFWKSCRFMMSSSCFIHRNNLLTLTSAHAARHWFGALHLF